MQRPDGTLFITFATIDRWVLPELVRQLVIDVCLVGHLDRFVLHAAVVMPDHVHLLLTPARDGNGNSFGFAEIMSAIKGTSSHRINRALGRRGRLWQAESFDRIVRTTESLRQKAEYICENPVRAGLAKSADEYKWIWREWAEGGDQRRPDARQPGTAVLHSGTAPNNNMEV